MKKHLKKSRTLAMLLAVLVVLIIGLGIYLFQAKISPKAEGEVASLQLAPASDVYTVGNSFDVQISVNTGDQAISGVDVILFYPVDLLEAQTAVINNATFPNGKAIIDAANHKIIMTANVDTGSNFTGGIAQVATMRFKALTAGQALVTFDFTLGSAADSNVTTIDAVTGMPKDILGSVNTGDYTIQTVSTPSCGDAVCDSSENCDTCAADCGSCPPPPPVCGDGSCNGSETCSTCVNDCGGCPPPPPGAKCGDKVCSSTESCSTCSSDCGVCTPPPASPTPTATASTVARKSPTPRPTTTLTSTPLPTLSTSPIYPVAFTSPSSSSEPTKTGGFNLSARWLYVVIPLVVIVLAFIFYTYYSKPKTKEANDDFDILNE